MTTETAQNEPLHLSLEKMSIEATLPADWKEGSFIGRVWRSDIQPEGPSVVALDKDGYLVDITTSFPTVSKLCNQEDPAAAMREALERNKGNRIGRFSEILANTPLHAQKKGKPYLISPADLQAVKAAGVTFADSLIERSVEKLAGGDPAKADNIRKDIHAVIRGKMGLAETDEIDLSKMKPGSPQALELRDYLIDKGLQKSYLEVGLGPDAEIFTKAQPMATVGHGAHAGVHPGSKWNNPEPEVVMVAGKSGKAVGAALGNDVNCRDIEGESELKLGECKDQNASATMGPLIRLFDKSFTLDDVRTMDVGLEVSNAEDGYKVDAVSSMSKISRDPQNELLAQTFAHHQYPDGALLYCGTMFAAAMVPRDKEHPEKGFTHKYGDVVTITSSKLGSVTNVMQSADLCPKWEVGAGALMENLAERGLLVGTSQAQGSGPRIATRGARL